MQKRTAQSCHLSLSSSTFCLLIQHVHVDQHIVGENDALFKSNTDQPRPVSDWYGLPTPHFRGGRGFDLNGTCKSHCASKLLENVVYVFHDMYINTIRVDMST